MTTKKNKNLPEVDAISPDVSSAISQVFSDDKSVVDALKDLLSNLESQQTRAAAIKSLHDLAEHIEVSGHNILVYKSVPIPQSHQQIRLLLHPAVFSPEYWGRTFAEGLLKQPEVFYGKKVVELGTGSGWISLLLLMRTGVSQVLALDLNPVAVLIAQLNKWLNGTTRDGLLLNSQFGVPIIQALTVAESDLLKVAVDASLKFDHAIGCIPQVLHPDPESLKDASQSSESDLYDLSNYCFQQGILEDRYGLPLIARALEESQLCLLPGGSVTLILGGRPGQDAIESVFHRRGYTTDLVWSRRIPQADDTDLASLVTLERAYGIQFHFFIARDSRQSVSADTAVSLLSENKNIFHDLLVYTAKTAHEKPTFAVVQDLHNLGLDSLRRELDLSATTEEQISFLAKLTSDLQKYKTIPYPHERGDSSIRSRLAKFLAIYCHYQVDESQLFVGPERAQLIANVLKMLLESEQSILISNKLLPVYEDFIAPGHKVIRGNDDLNELLLLDDWLTPKVVLIAPAQLEVASPMLLKVIMEQAKKHPERIYIIDDSAHFDISSSLQANIFLRLAGQHELPPNLVFVYGLVKSTVAPDLELSFLLNAPFDWAHNLEIGAELTYSRISYISQLYYEWLFDELLAFPFDDPLPHQTNSQEGQQSVISDSFKQIASDESFAPKSIEVDDEVIRFDYGELEFAVPGVIVEGLIKGFLEPKEQDLKPLVKRRVVDYIRSTRGAPSFDSERVVLAQGVFPLFGSLLRVLAERLGRPPVVAVPEATYGLIYPLVAYHGAKLKVIPTNVKSKFSITEYELNNFVCDASGDVSEKADLLWLTQPGNPSGFFMEPLEIQTIMDFCQEKQIYVLADEIFFLLSDISMGEQTPHDLSFGQFLGADASRFLFLTDGLSKSFAAGGLRAGEMICPDVQFAIDIAKYLPAPPQAVLRACDSLYSLYAPGNEEDIFASETSLRSSKDRFDHNRMKTERKILSSYLQQTRQSISFQREAILSLLKKFGADDCIDSRFRGGFFILSKLGQFVDAIATDEKLLLNPDSWSRTAEWSRICCGLTQDRFEKGYARLKQFLERS